MRIFKKFIKLMKGEPVRDKKKFTWIIDESKCLSIREVGKLKRFSNKVKILALKKMKFSPVRNWFMIELGLNAGLRVEEIASLQHGNLLIDKARSSIVVVGKGGKKRAVWINSAFKKICHIYIDYKKKFGYGIDDESYLLNNLKGTKISKRSLQKFFKKIVIKAGLPGHYHIHCLRHTFATFLLKASNNNYKFVQDQLGHASLKTTQVYAGVVESEGRKAVERMYR